MRLFRQPTLNWTGMWSQVKEAGVTAIVHPHPFEHSSGSRHLFRGITTSLGCTEGHGDCLQCKQSHGLALSVLVRGYPFIIAWMRIDGSGLKGNGKRFKATRSLSLHQRPPGVGSDAPHGRRESVAGGCQGWTPGAGSADSLKRLGQARR